MGPGACPGPLWGSGLGMALVPACGRWAGLTLGIGPRGKCLRRATKERGRGGSSSLLPALLRGQTRADAQACADSARASECTLRVRRLGGGWCCVDPPTRGAPMHYWCVGAAYMCDAQCMCDAQSCHPVILARPGDGLFRLELPGTTRSSTSRTPTGGGDAGRRTSPGHPRRDRRDRLARC